MSGEGGGEGGSGAAQPTRTAQQQKAHHGGANPEPQWIFIVHLHKPVNGARSVIAVTRDHFATITAAAAATSCVAAVARLHSLHQVLALPIAQVQARHAGRAIHARVAKPGVAHTFRLAIQATDTGTDAVANTIAGGWTAGCVSVQDKEGTWC